MTFDNLLVALRGLLANRMRSILTMLGILIGTFDDGDEAEHAKVAVIAGSAS